LYSGLYLEIATERAPSVDLKFNAPKNASYRFELILDKILAVLKIWDSIN